MLELVGDDFYNKHMDIYIMNECYWIFIRFKTRLLLSAIGSPSIRFDSITLDNKSFYKSPQLVSFHYREGYYIDFPMNASRKMIKDIYNAISSKDNHNLTSTLDLDGVVDAFDKFNDECSHLKDLDPHTLTYFNSMLGSCTRLGYTSLSINDIDYIYNSFEKHMITNPENVSPEFYRKTAMQVFKEYRDKYDYSSLYSKGIYK